MSGLTVRLAALAGILPTALLGTACNCDTQILHARSPVVSPGVAYPDTCVRVGRGSPDFDGAFWRAADRTVAPAAELHCSTAAPASSRGTYVLTGPDHADYRAPDGEVQHLVRIGSTLQTTCG